MSRRTLAAAAAYVIPSFVIAVIWHLQVFAPRYDALEIYRADMVIPFGLAAMLIQGVLFGLAVPWVTGGRAGLAECLRFAGLAALLSWSYTTLPVAAKFPMTSVSGFVMLETGFTLAQWAVAGPLMVLAARVPQRLDAAARVAA